MNLVFVIIIDTFASLRTQKVEKEKDMMNVCFICGIDRAAFDRYSERGFEDHIQHDHYLWNYISMFAHLLYKPRTELTGVEEYLLQKVFCSTHG